MKHKDARTTVGPIHSDSESVSVDARVRILRVARPPVKLRCVGSILVPVRAGGSVGRPRDPEGSQFPSLSSSLPLEGDARSEGAALVFGATRTRFAKPRSLWSSSPLPRLCPLPEARGSGWI